MMAKLKQLRKVWIRGTSMVLMLSFLLVSACATAQKSSSRKKGKQGTVAKPAKVAEVRIAKLVYGPCLGKCPSYEAEIFRPGKLVFTGKAHVPKVGRYVYALQESFLKYLLTEARKAKFHQFQNTYVGAPDFPARHITLFLDGKEKTIDYGPDAAPPELKTMAQELNDNIMRILEEQEPMEQPAANPVTGRSAD